jgi:hypothetical protein
MRYRFFSACALAFAMTTLAYTTYGQDFSATGGRALGMAGSSILLTDEYGIFNNPGATKANNLTFLAAYNTQYLNLGLNDARIALVMPLNKLTTAVGVLYFGDELFNQMRVSALIADEFGFAKAALKVNYHQFYVQNYGYRSALTLDIGGVFTLSEQLSLAMVFQNITRSKLIAETGTPLSSLMQMGLSYQPIKKFRIDAQLDKTIEQPLLFRLGLEYVATDLISLRTGFSPTSVAALGIGLNWKTITIDVAGQYHQQLGYSGTISLKIIKLKK